MTTHRTVDITSTYSYARSSSFYPSSHHRKNGDRHPLQRTLRLAFWRIAAELFVLTAEISLGEMAKTRSVPACMDSPYGACSIALYHTK